MDATLVNMYLWPTARHCQGSHTEPLPANYREGV